MYLLDTNVVSEFRRIGAGRGDQRVGEWAGAIPHSEQFISALTILELERGCLRLSRKDEVQGRLLRNWLESALLPSLAGRVLPVDDQVATLCAALHVPDPRPEIDALIAATAMVHRLTLVTRNIADFVPMGVRCINPWEDQG